jgi:hypothetical protein
VRSRLVRIVFVASLLAMLALSAAAPASAGLMYIPTGNDDIF